LQVVFPSGATGTLGAIVGTVVDSRRWSSTHVSSSGGGGQAGGYVAPPVVSSRTVENHEFWVQTKDNIPPQHFNLDIPVTNGHLVCLISSNVMGKNRLVYWANYTSMSQGIINPADRDILYGHNGAMVVLYHFLTLAAITYGLCLIPSFLIVSHLATSRDSSATILGLTLLFGGCFAFWPLLIVAVKTGQKRTKVMVRNRPALMKICEPVAIQIFEAMWPGEPLRLSWQARDESRFLVSSRSPDPMGWMLLYGLAALCGLFALFSLLGIFVTHSFSPAIACIVSVALAFGLFKAGGFVRKKGTAVMVAPPGPDSPPTSRASTW
jgi:hypothetical protein